MSSSKQPLRQSGIYRNLPTFDPDIKGLKAIVCGATGIPGFNTIRSLLDTPDRWSTIYALSRSPLSEDLLAFLTDEQRSHIQHVSIDFGSSGQDIAKSLKDAGVKADYVFSYLSPKNGESAMHPSATDDLVKSNIPPFKNFLGPKRILLKTGGKNYGMHMGRVRTPLVESDPQPTRLGPNFYYNQEEVLMQFCDEHPETDWNVVMPAAIIGTTKYASMNTALSWGVYAAVQAHMKEPIRFASEMAAWQFEYTHSTARLTGYLSEWAVLEEDCKNQRFNAQDGGLFSHDRFYNELGRWFGVDTVLGPNEDESKYEATATFSGGKDCPLGYGPPIPLRVAHSLQKWAEEPSVSQAWDEMMKESRGQLKTKVFEDKDTFLMADFSLATFGTLCMNKVKRYGFNGFVDTVESIFEVYQEMAKIGMLPPMKVDSARPLV